MIEDEDDRTYPRHAVCPAHLDSPEEDAEHDAQQREQQGSHLLRHAAYVQINPPTSTAIGMIKTA